jgi:hypothetical protein
LRFYVWSPAKNTHVFREEGVSGTKELENWPALLDLMTAPHSNGVKLVLVEKLAGSLATS